MDDLLIKVNGESILLDACGAAFSPAYATLMFADLHLEKGSSYAVNALKLLPRHDTRQTLKVLSALIDLLAPETVICLGDSFHDRTAISAFEANNTTEPRSAGPSWLSASRAAVRARSHRSPNPML